MSSNTKLCMDDKFGHNCNVSRVTSLDTEPTWATSLDQGWFGHIIAVTCNMNGGFGRNQSQHGRRVRIQSRHARVTSSDIKLTWETSPAGHKTNMSMSDEFGHIDNINGGFWRKAKIGLFSWVNFCLDLLFMLTLYPNSNPKIGLCLGDEFWHKTWDSSLDTVNMNNSFNKFKHKTMHGWRVSTRKQHKWRVWNFGP